MDSPDLAQLARAALRYGCAYSAASLSRMQACGAQLREQLTRPAGMGLRIVKPTSIHVSPPLLKVWVSLMLLACPKPFSVL